MNYKNRYLTYEVTLLRIYVLIKLLPNVAQIQPDILINPYAVPQMGLKRDGLYKENRREVIKMLPKKSNVYKIKIIRLCPFMSVYDHITIHAKNI